MKIKWLTILFLFFLMFFMLVLSAFFGESRFMEVTLENKVIEFSLSNTGIYWMVILCVIVVRITYLIFDPVVNWLFRWYYRDKVLEAGG